MKKILIIFSLSLLGSAVHAQDKKDQDKRPVQQSERMGKEEHFVFREGQLFQMKLGVHVMVQNQVKLSNGTTLNPNGSFELKTGEKNQLSEGEFVDTSGNVYADQNVFEQKRYANRPETQKRNK